MEVEVNVCIFAIQLANRQGSERKFQRTNGKGPGTSGKRPGTSGRGPGTSVKDPRTSGTGTSTGSGGTFMVSFTGALKVLITPLVCIKECTVHCTKWSIMQYNVQPCLQRGMVCCIIYSTVYRLEWCAVKDINYRV